MLETLNSFLEKWEPIWLFLILFIEGTIGFVTLKWIIREYYYDSDKDVARKQKKTKTTKKTTTQPSGTSVIEETSEIVENTPDQKIEEKKQI